MRIGELARQSGVPVPTIKYYTREGLLPTGERTGPNQVHYAQSHVRRLKLIRALIDVGGLSVAAAAEVLADADSPDPSVHGVLGTGRTAVRRSAAPEAGDDETWARAEREVAELVRRHDWDVKPRNPGRQSLVQIVATYRDLDHGELLGLLDRYADAARKLATAELDLVGGLASGDAKVEGVVLGTLLGDAAMAALRRIAQEDISRRSRREEGRGEGGEGSRRSGRLG